MVSSNDDVFIAWMSHGNTQILECGLDTLTRTELDDALDDISCNNMIVVISFCHSGTFIGGGMDDETNRAILTSDSGDTSSYATTEHSYFSYGIIRALDSDLYAEEADENDDGHVSVDELFDYAYDYVDSFNPFGFVSQIPDHYFGSGFSETTTYLGDQYY